MLIAAPRMFTTKSEFIVPNKLAWLAMLVMIGLFGFAAQVGESLTYIHDIDFWLETLLTMGLARETASRGSLAIYTQAS